MKIAINGGHFDPLDSGAVGASGLHEANVTYRIMGLVMYYLQQVGFETLQIYENELQDICSQSNNWGADLFISIHCNAAENRSAQGTETFCMTEFSEGGKLARCIQAQIVNNLGTVDRGVKAGNSLYVIKHTDCPAVLVETAFISNEEDEKLLMDDSKLDQFAAAIARGVTDYVAKTY